MYSWKDANGKIHYGDRPPAEKQTQARKVQGAPSETGDVEAARKTSAERQFSEREKQESAKKPAEDHAQAKVREENCQRARSNLAALESGQIRFSTDAKGERVALDGAVRDAELARARKAADDWCKPPATVK